MTIPGRDAYSFSTLAIVLLVTTAVPLFGDESRAPAREPDVPYVPTPPVVVEAMLKLANITKDDVVYDLGCGDGRIVISAARDFGARGVGIDINPSLIEESNKNAEEAGVADRVRFVVDDIFEDSVDLRETTVVALYLLPELNLRLRPKLLRDLRPGARIVSNSFDMGDWEPTVKLEVVNRFVYLWIVPERPAQQNVETPIH